MEEQKVNECIDMALNGNVAALEELLLSVQDLVFNLSLRMLGTVMDAEDATQEILIRIMTNLSTFRKESAFTTWVYRLAVNYLINYKKAMFAQQPLSFEIYGNDIKYGSVDETEELIDEMTRAKMSEELKMSCTNVMLQCLDAKSRCIFILGTMFRVNSKIAGEVLDMSPENYRKKLSRIREKVASFLACYCGLSGSGMCSCNKRVGYAITQKRINTEKPEYTSLQKLDKELLCDCKDEMEKLDELSMVFEKLPDYRLPEGARKMVQSLLQSQQLEKIQQF